MIYTDELPHTFDYFAEDFYKQQNVTADNFDSLKTSLYSNAGVKILEGMQKIKFNYYSPSDQLLASDTVLVVKEGGHLPDNLGVESVTPSDALKDDYFIYTGEDTDNYKYGDLIQFDGTNWEKVPDSSEKVAQSLSTALNDDSLNWNKILENEGVLSRIISKLAINKAFIKSLASTMIKLNRDETGGGGIIYSQDYNGLIDSGTGQIDPEITGTKGWAIDSYGNSDFSNLHANNGNFVNCTFSGTLDCGQLQVKQGNLPYDQAIITSGMSAQDIIRKCINKLIDNIGYTPLDDCYGDSIYIPDTPVWINSYITYWVNINEILNYNEEVIFYRVSAPSVQVKSIGFKLFEKRFITTGAGYVKDELNYSIFISDMDLSSYKKAESALGAYDMYMDIGGNYQQPLIAIYEYVGNKTLKQNSSNYYRYDQENYTTKNNSTVSNSNIIKGKGEINSYLFSLNNLPTVKPAKSGYVWNDSGTLKLS